MVKFLSDIRRINFIYKWCFSSSAFYLNISDYLISPLIHISMLYGITNKAGIFIQFWPYVILYISFIIANQFLHHPGPILYIHISFLQVLFTVISKQLLHFFEQCKQLKSEAILSSIHNKVDICIVFTWNWVVFHLKYVLLFVFFFSNLEKIANKQKRFFSFLFEIQPNMETLIKFWNGCNVNLVYLNAMLISINFGNVFSIFLCHQYLLQVKC